MVNVAELVRKSKLSHEDVKALHKLYSEVDFLKPKGYRLHNTKEELELLDLLSKSVGLGLVEDKGKRVKQPSITSMGKPLYSETHFALKPEAKLSIVEYLKNHSG